MDQVRCHFVNWEMGCSPIPTRGLGMMGEILGGMGSMV